MKSEIVIKDDKFFIRHVKEIEIEDEDVMLQACLREETYQFDGLAHAPLQSWTDHYYTMRAGPTLFFVFHKINLFPLANAALCRFDGDGDSHFTPWPVSETDQRRFEERSSDNTPRYKWMGRDLTWPTKMARKSHFFIMFRIEFTPPATQRCAYEPMFFAINESGCPVIPRFPNIHTDGKICTGHDYMPTVNDRIGSSTQTMKKALQQLRISPPNHDLNTGYWSNIMKFDDDGAPIPLQSAISGQSVSNEIILEFSNKYKKAGLI